MRTILIGDIHGCYDEFMALLEKTGLRTEDDRLIFIGDLIDRGKDPCLVIEKAQALKEAMGNRCIILRGNHEQMMIDAIRNPEDRALWKSNGAAKTIQSFYRHGKRYSMALEWLLSTSLYYEDAHMIAAHASVSSQGPTETDLDTFIWDRTLVYSGKYRGKLLVMGHTPMRDVLYQSGLGVAVLLKEEESYPLPARGSICIDTGCVYGNRLTAMVIEDGRFRLLAVPSQREINLLSY